MKDTTRVNLHCHSFFSDGELAPEAVAEKLAAAGVQYASLTDHDSIEGLPRFHEALNRKNIGFLPGVEITSYYQEREIHLLGYGFDADHQELKATLQLLRHERLLRVQGPLRKMPIPQPPVLNAEPAPGVLEKGSLEVHEAIALLHRAGGRAFLAHPPTLELGPDALDHLLADLKTMGLDGIEALCTLFPPSDQERLIQLAQKHNLLICAGSDFHAAGGTEKPACWVDMPTPVWKQLIHAICAMPDHASSLSMKALDPELVPGSDFVLRPWSFVRARIVLPSLLAIVLFGAAIWGLLLPSVENILIDRKREMILELTNSAMSLLAEAERAERSGLLTRRQAQETAKARISALRYGKEGKDYFWLQDLHPRMLMHPYRPDLNGQDVSRFTDPRGARIFVEFADLVRKQQQGYVEYVWQWKDDPARLVAKESYVRGFKPWGWIIGTGIYIDDVKEEIRRIEQSLVYALLAIAALVFLLLLYIFRQSLHIERKRADTQASLQEAKERYRSLIEATTEGTLLVLDGRCRYSNPTMLQMTGYSAERLELLELSDLLHRDAVNEAVWAHIEQLSAGSAGSGSFEAVMERVDGKKVECIITLNPIAVDGRPGIILLAKEVMPSRPGTESIRRLGQAAQSAPIGIFQAKAARRGTFIELNAAARTLVQSITLSGVARFTLADFFEDASDYEEFFQLLRKEGSVEDRIIHVETLDARSCTLSLSAALVHDEQGEPLQINGVIRDITDAVKRDVEREALIHKLQSSLLFLHDPIGPSGGPVVTCSLNTPIYKAAALMLARNTTGILVEAEAGVPVGFVTDHDFRERVAGNNQADLQAPVRTIMSAPLITISEHALIYEALMRMEEKQVQHLAVEDENRRIVRIVRSKELMQFHRYGPTVLPREISRAKTTEEVSAYCGRVPALVKALLDVGARPRNVTHMISSVCDSATDRFIRFALEELGPPPVPFAFMALGSQGRQEQTLLTDQDNAIIFQHQEDPIAQAAASDYFLALGGRVCEWLDHAGYPFCNGKAMANNPVWCRSLPAWKDHFKNWIMKAEPQELMEFSIFFDFRTVYGSAEFAQELRVYIDGILNDRPNFLPFLAQNALLFKPPVTLLGRIIKRGGPTEEAGLLNLKEALMPLVGYGRLYALRNKINHTHTMKRIEALVEKNVLAQPVCDGIAASYDFLMRLRFQNQLSAMQAGRNPDNSVLPDKLGFMEEAMLKQAFQQIEAAQKQIIYDFLGGAEWPGA